MTETIHNLKEELLQTIKTGSLKQKPKWYFAFFSFLSVVGILTLFTLLLYITSFIVLVFGEEINFRGGAHFFEMIHVLPIVLILFVIILLCTLFVLIHHYRFSYKKPVLYSIVGIFLVTTILTIGLTAFDNEMRFARIGEDSDMPIIRTMHQHYRPHHEFHIYQVPPFPGPVLIEVQK
ncbi:MAG: hypothetical protein WCO58_03285 [bacterium]